MSEIPTIAQLRADEALLRRTIGEVLNPGPHLHEPRDRMAIETTCAYCDAVIRSRKSQPSCRRDFSGPLEVAAELLVKMLTAMPAHQWYKPFLDTLRSLVDTDGDTVMWWLVATPTDRVLCCLLALGAARMEGE